MAIVDVVVTSASEDPLETMDSIDVADARVADTVTVDIQCYCRRYCWTEALPFVPMLVMSIPIQMML